MSSPQCATFPVPGREDARIVVLPASSSQDAALGDAGGDTDLYMKGKLRLSVLSGGDGASVRCFGYDMRCGTAKEMDEGDTARSSYEIFSPRGYRYLTQEGKVCCRVSASDVFSLLGLSAHASPGSKSATLDRKEIARLKRRLKGLGFQGEELEEVVSSVKSFRPAVAVLLSRMDAADGENRTKMPGANLLPGTDLRSVMGRMSLFGRDATLPGKLSLPASFCPESEKALDVNLFLGRSSVPGLRYLTAAPEWEQLLQTAERQREGGAARIMVVGGKGVGKSTLTKYLTNRLLSSSASVSSVLYVDVDPGQAEFTVPACLSVSVVKEPLLGPNFCHLGQKKVASVFLGDVNVSNVRQRYLSALSYLANACKALADKDTVWVINSMGFNQGLGLPLLKATVEHFSPTVIASIESGHPSKNYPPDFVSSLASVNDNCELLRFGAVPEDKGAVMGAQDLWGMPQPWKLRDLVISAYFSSTTAVTVTVDWRNVFVQCLVRDLPVKNLLRAMNCGLVALCSTKGTVQEDKDVRRLPNGLRLLSHHWVGDCLGFGVVRGVDPVQKQLFVVTPLGLEELRGVDCLCLGSLVLPEAMRARWWGAALEAKRGESPRNPLAEAWQRSRKPRANFQ